VPFSGKFATQACMNCDRLLPLFDMSDPRRATGAGADKHP
jgi:hypothetical protein